MFMWVKDHVLMQPTPQGGNPSLHYFARQIYCGGCVPHRSHTLTGPCIAFPLLQISHLCVFCDILSPKAVYRVSCLFTNPRCFLWLTMYGTTHAHSVHMCWPLLWGLHQMGSSFATYGTCALVGSFKWIMRVLNSTGWMLWWLHHPSPQRRQTLPPWHHNTRTRAVCLHQWRVPQFPLKYPCNPPPPRGETPPPKGETVARHGGRLQGGKGSRPMFSCEPPAGCSFVCFAVQNIAHRHRLLTAVAPLIENKCGNGGAKQGTLAWSAHASLHFWFFVGCFLLTIVHTYIFASLVITPPPPYVNAYDCCGCGCACAGPPLLCFLY